MTQVVQRAAWGVVHAARAVALQSAPGHPPPEVALEALRVAVTELEAAYQTSPG
jgi:hypothetical protein